MDPHRSNDSRWQEMDSEHLQNSEVPDQRTLASIMFTDVVAFSKHAAFNEERTFAALNRDFALFYEIIRLHRGEVLNTMGDGMMVIFLSASECIRAAMEMQFALHQQSLTGPVHGVLEHRFGLHIGEIYLNGKNTMGDGVNQAARIQSLAKPNAIAMSRDFYDLVKRDCQDRAKYLGPQRVKNIPESIPIFEIPAIDQEAKLKAAEALFKAPEPQSEFGATGRKGLVLLLIVVIMFGIAMIPLFTMSKAAQLAKDQRKKEGREFGEGSIQDNKKALEELKVKLAGSTTSDQNKTDQGSQPAPAPVAPEVFALTPDQLRNIENLTEAYDYAGVVGVIKGASGATTPEGLKMSALYESLLEFKAWLTLEVNAATGENPIVGIIRGQECRVFGSKDGIVIDNGSGQPNIRPLWDYKPDTLYDLATVILAGSVSASPVPPKALEWVANFKSVHRV